MSDLDSYTARLLAITCPQCGVAPYQRCKPASGMPTTRGMRPHAARVKMAQGATSPKGDTIDDKQPEEE